MKLSQFLLVGAIGVLLASPRCCTRPRRQDRRPADCRPAQSIDQILDKVKKSLKVFVPEKAYKDIEKGLLGAIDMQKLAGLDTKRPFGLYATLDAGLLQANFEKSVAVLMVPVTNEKEFLALLERGKLPVEKKDGFYSISVPNFPVELALRFYKKDYAYVGFAGKDLDMKLLLDPREVISSKETAALVIKFRIDQIPKELKDAGIGFMEQALEQAKNPALGEKQAELLQKTLKMVVGWYEMGLNDGRELVERIDLDPPSGELRIEVTLDGKPQSKLAKSIAGIPPSKNDFLGIVGKDSVGHVLIEMPLFNDELRGIFTGLSDLALSYFTKKTKGMAEELVTAGTKAIKALGRTVKSGDMDLAASLRGPNKDGLFNAIAAVRLKNTAALEKALRGAVKLAPGEFQKALKLDAGKIDGMAVHELDFSDEMPAEMKRGFGKSPKLYVLFAPDALYLSFGPDGMTILKDALTSKGGPAPLIQAEMNAKRLGKFIKAVRDPKDGQDYFDQLAKLDRIAVFTFDISGGEKLSLKYSYGAVPLILWMVPIRSSATNVAPMAIPLCRPRPRKKQRPRSRELRRVSVSLAFCQIRFKASETLALRSVESSLETC